MYEIDYKQIFIGDILCLFSFTKDCKVPYKLS